MWGVRSAVAALAIGGVLGLGTPRAAAQSVAPQNGPAAPQAVYPQPAYPPPAQPVYPPPPYAPYGYVPGTLTPAPPPRTERRSRRPLWLSGLGCFALFYGISVLVAATTRSGDDDLLLVPLAGPWIYMGDRSLSRDERVLLGFDGALQDLGILAFVFGIASTEETEVDARGGPHRRLVLAPFVRPDGAGATLTLF